MTTELKWKTKEDIFRSRSQIHWLRRCF